MPSKEERQRLPPGKYFISHSYSDQDRCGELCRRLPKSAEPQIFPPIRVSPNEMVTNTLLKSILGCDGLIWLEGGASANSFWVAFERDYAKRAGKRVWKCEKITLDFVQDDSKPPAIQVSVINEKQDLPFIKSVMDIMVVERHFSLTWGTKTTFESISRDVDRGDYILVFWSYWAAASKDIIGFLENLRDHWIVKQSLSSRLLFALLDTAPLPTWYQEIANHENTVVPVRIFREDRTNNRVDMNAVDNLIVRLYWLVYGNTLMV